jgi:GT2 family glycosyltransferase/glycosyltransferase involved in cell wall biosynthesis/Flp pilus assembly protein TadD
VRASIVIPVFNKVEYTRKCLEALSKNTAEGTYEVIIVDNASTDGTKEYLTSLNGKVKVISNETNFGFTEACNQGARIATGEYVMFLNNDTEPQPRWLESLIELVESDNSVGIVGSKLVYPDGRLQEAGGIIFSDGNGWNYGRFGHPEDPRYEYVREVDYVSGASLLIRTELLKKLNYFDEQYSPGYYEDTDLCFSVRSLGYKVMYCPFSIVIHHEGVTSGTDLAEGMKQYQIVNREKFVNKWKNVLQERYPYDPKNVVAASERNVQGNILVMDPFLPRFDKASGSLRLFSIISLMKEMNYHVTYVARNGMEEERYGPILRRMGIEVYAVDPEKLEQYGSKLNIKGGDIRRIISSRSYDIAYLSFYEIALEYLSVIRLYSPKTKIIVDSVDIHFIREMRMAKLQHNKVLLEEAKKTKKNELSIYGKADAVITVTEQDWDHIKEYLPHKKHFVIPNIHTVDNNTVTIDERNGLLFIGNFSHPPNEGAVKYFVKEIFPILKQKIPDISFTIVGNNPPQDILAMKSNNIRITGYVPSTEPYLRKARVSIAPLLYGAGLKGKIGEAMAYGLPVVTTTVGAEGFGLTSGENAFIADSPRDFAECIVKLCSDDQLWRRMAAKGKEFIMEHYSPQKVRQQLSDMFVHTADIEPMGLTGEDMKTILFIGEEPITASLFEKREVTKGLVSIVILTFNQFRYTKECVESIRKHTPEPHEIIFVDNGSKDETVKWLRKAVKESINFKLIENAKNLGFAKGCNQGILASSGEYILLLNNDIVATEGWLSGMIECINSAPDIGIVGPMTNQIIGIQKVENATYESVAHLAEYAKSFRGMNRHRRIPSRRIVGFCLLFRRELVEKIGLLDERFGSGNYEDDDYCIRAAIEGYSNLIAGDVFIHHYGSRSFIGNRIDHSAAMTRNRDLFIRKWNILHQGPLRKKLLTLNSLTMANELSQKGQIQKAIDTLREGLRSISDDKRLHYALAEILIENEKFTDALEALENMPEGLRQDFRRFELIGYCKEGMEADEEADRYADEALILNNASSEAWNLKGTIAFKKGLHADAEKFFLKATESDNGFGKAYTNLGALKWAADDKEEAIRLFEKAFILAPTIGDTVINYHAATASLSRLARAEELFRDAITLNPSNKRLKYMLVGILSQQGKYDEAMKTIEESMFEFGIDDNTLSVALELRNKIGDKEVDKALKDTISLCMIVKNEQSRIGGCLKKNGPIVDEIIVVDTGSTDRTKDIAKAFGAKVYDFEWTDNFSDARNFSISKASGKWILILDADEVISSLDHESLKKLVKIHPPSIPPLPRGDTEGSKGGDGGLVAYSFITRNYVMRTNISGWTANNGQYEEEAGTGWFGGDKVRLFPNDGRIHFEDPIHERIDSSLLDAGIQIKHCDIPIHHYGMLDEKKTASKSEYYYELGKARLAEKGEQDVNALYDLSVQAAEIRKYEEALEYLNKVVLLRPDFYDAFESMGIANYNLGRYEDALSSFKKAIHLDPDLKKTTRDTIMMYSNCEICVGDVEIAISRLEDLLRKHPAYPLAMASLAAAYFCAGRKEKGLKYLKKLRDMNFSCADYFPEFARMLISTKRLDYAISLLEAATEINEVSKDTPVLLAECKKML